MSTNPFVSVEGRLQTRRIGAASFRRSFGLEFLLEEDLPPVPQLVPGMRVIPADSRYGLRFDLAGKRVAVVGNGAVKGRGGVIDGHDEVIRLSSMRHWRHSPLDDGERITLWAGQPEFVVALDETGRPAARPSFAAIVAQGVPLWGMSPFHVSLPSYCWLKERGALARLMIAPPPAAICDMMCEWMEAETLAEIFSLVPKRGKLVGQTYFDVLFTGTRLVLLLELCGVTEISLFGCDLFLRSVEPVWWGHDPALDRRVLLGCQQRLRRRGGDLRWPEADLFD